MPRSSTQADPLISAGNLSELPEPPPSFSGDRGYFKRADCGIVGTAHMTPPLVETHVLALNRLSIDAARRR